MTISSPASGHSPSHLHHTDKHFNEHELLKKFNTKRKFSESYDLLDAIQQANHSSEFDDFLIFTRLEDIHQSFGNYLSDYLETRICANLSNLHFWSPILGNRSHIRDHFPLPRFVYHPNHTSIKNKTYEEMVQLCPCRRNCHESLAALIFSHPNHAKDILFPLFHSLSRFVPKYISLASSTVWMKTVRNPYPLLQTSERHQRQHQHQRNDTRSSPETLQQVELIPSTPEVIIHYRCSDNIRHRKMGLMSFNQFNPTFIPMNTSTIYILTEPPTRVSQIWHHPATLCDSIIQTLHQHLSAQFPNTTVITLRGEPLLHDIYRIYSSMIIFCSPSTFCYFPALSSSYPKPNLRVDYQIPSPSKVYTPVTGLIAGLWIENSHPHFYDLGIKSTCDKFLLLPKLSNHSLVIQCLQNSCQC